MYRSKKLENIRKIAIIGNYLPRQCGIATFTTDLTEALAKEVEYKKDLINIAMDDTPEGYDYSSQVKFRIRQNVLSDYYSAAEYLNAKQYQCTILQHEYGIFGGDNGAHILYLLKSLRMPIITNLHTVLENPTESQFAVIKRLAKYSSKLLVMSHKAFSILEKVYGIKKSLIQFIPHGIPDASFETTGLYNEQFGIRKNQDMILTFGLLSPGKGIENMIEAMPKIVKKHPNVIYVILGQTHPHIIESAGDSYRSSLQQLVTKLKMDDYIVFHNRFVDLDTLVLYLQTTKIYAVPYLTKEQITSGTLAYALGIGVATVSTPFWYAEEMLADGRGKLVPFNDPAAFAKEINALLVNNKQLKEMKLKAYQHGRSMIWQEVAKQHLRVIEEVKETFSVAKIKEKVIIEHKIINKLPEVDLSHLRTLTDDTGILQHAKHTIPNYNHGYCVDDNARALIVTNMYYSLRKDKSTLPLLKKYLSFLLYSFNHENGRFRNFMSFDRTWSEILGSEDSHARVIWSLGELIKTPPNKSIRDIAMQLFIEALPVVSKFTSPRSWAYTIIGLQAYLSIYVGDTFVRDLRDLLAKRLLAIFNNNTSEDWLWCEDYVTYANAVLPHALIMAGQWVPDKKMYKTGIKALEWLLKIQTAKQGHLSIIGNIGWHNRSGKTAKFDQQPIEAMCLVNACLEVYTTTKKDEWFKEAERCLRWFLGDNDLQTPVYDFESGGCGDGISAYGVNANQGAESTLAWLISLLKMYASS